MLLTVAAAIAALLVAFLPTTASAEQDMPTAAGTNAMAPDWELNYAVAGTLPPRSELVCRSVPAVEVCYEAYGDRWWVQDQDADGASAAVRWHNYRSGALYRYGMCVNSLGNGKWGQCNKNYYETSRLQGYPCVWDRSQGDNAVCNLGVNWRFQ